MCVEKRVGRTGCASHAVLIRSPCGMAFPSPDVGEWSFCQATDGPAPTGQAVKMAVDEVFDDMRVGDVKFQIDFFEGAEIVVQETAWCPLCRSRTAHLAWLRPTRLLKAGSISPASQSEAEPLATLWRETALINSPGLPTGTDMCFHPEILKGSDAVQDQLDPPTPHSDQPEPTDHGITRLPAHLSAFDRAILFLSSFFSARSPISAPSTQPPTNRARIVLGPSSFSDCRHRARLAPGILQILSLPPRDDLHKCEWPPSFFSRSRFLAFPFRLQTRAHVPPHSKDTSPPRANCLLHTRPCHHRQPYRRRLCWRCLATLSVVVAPVCISHLQIVHTSRELVSQAHIAVDRFLICRERLLTRRKVDFMSHLLH